MNTRIALAVLGMAAAVSSASADVNGARVQDPDALGVIENRSNDGPYAPDQSALSQSVQEEQPGQRAGIQPGQGGPATVQSSILGQPGRFENEKFGVGGSALSTGGKRSSTAGGGGAAGGPSGATTGSSAGFTTGNASGGGGR